jgi:hypothetical protein
MWFSSIPEKPGLVSAATKLASAMTPPLAPDPGAQDHLACRRREMDPIVITIIIIETSVPHQRISL